LTLREITGQKNRDTALIAEKALEKLIYIDEKNRALGNFILSGRVD
jgi:hypothetical protein